MYLRLLLICIVSGISLVSSKVDCPGGGYQCPDRTTCCSLGGGVYGCCPMEQAVCCSDNEHCCPHGTQCDLGHGRCKNSVGHHRPWASKIPATPRPNSYSVTCPDHHSTCPSGTTCCLMSGGQYGCCPLPQAVCCSDHVHCCPHATICDISHQKCRQGDGTRIPWMAKFPARTNEVNGIVCPDHSAECPSGTTCCKMSTGQWGCCPLPNAVCCSDKIHCCPHASRCDTAHSQCIRRDGSMTAWYGKRPSRPISGGRVPNRLQCPDRASTCPDDTTCCRLENGGWGCCPFRNAVCCSDRRHCCPPRTHCDTTRQRCIVEESFMTNLTTIFESNTITEAVSQERQCPDGNFCPTPGTCCRRRYGVGYNCCAIPNAICCDSHCCPRGYRCGRGAGHKCIKDAKYRPELRMIAQHQESSSEEDFFLFK